MATEIQDSSACHQSAAESTCGVSLRSELAAGLRVGHMEHDVGAVIRLGPIAQHRRLNVVELDGDRCARKVGAEAIDEGHGVLPD